MLGAKENSMTICSVGELHENISSCWGEMFELFRGVYKNVLVMSAERVKVLLHMPFAIPLLGCAIIGIRKILK